MRNEDKYTETEFASEHKIWLEQTSEELLALLEEKKYTVFSEKINEMNPVDIADFFEELDQESIPRVFKLLKKDVSAEVFAEFESDVQEKIISVLTDKELSWIVEELYVDDVTEMAHELPANVVHRVMKNTTPETRAQVNRLLSYPDDSAGSIMNADFISLRANMTCRSAIEHIRKTGVDKETVYTAYVTDSARVLKGTVSFKDLLFADENDSVSDIMEENVICAGTLDDRETVADTVSKYGLLALPIVDGEMRLVGMVTVDDAMDVMIEEATEDIEIMAAITPGDKPYLKTGVFETWKKRIPWLLILMVSAVFTSAIITHYESAIGTYAILTAFFPMLMDTGGNAGSQTSVTVIRGLSLEEIEPRDVFKVIWKEFRVSLLCGVCLAAVCFVKTMLIDFRLQSETILENGEVQNNLLVALIVSITVLTAVVVAKFIGTVFPIGAKKIGLDPAVMASPFITTIVDTVTLVVYFSIASRLLGFA